MLMLPQPVLLDGAVRRDVAFSAVGMRYFVHIHWHFEVQKMKVVSGGLCHDEIKSSLGQIVQYFGRKGSQSSSFGT